ncbi:hypothetical protein [Methylobacterium brachiatum]|uniref:hypothetical protein n=1 Tax=Methylobacterium brachiatum TaxID=269660 RepID=UPI00244A513D|nr:hypothetical protein [Methylobacterium brachiatum]MDH2313074.1 hypothetical protein [Methylobacterium brachiatum]
MMTGALILHADGTRMEREVELAPNPRYSELRASIRALLVLGSAYPEHVTVLHEGRQADMFVHEDGHGAGLPRNEAATAIYRAAWLREHPGHDPETLPCIAGPAVIFDRIVWS